jgi:hypothetical protein
MNILSFVLFVHVIGVIGLFLTIGFEWITDGEGDACAREFPRLYLHAHLKHVLGRRGAHLSGEDALEITGAHRHPLGEMIDRQSRLEVLGDPDLQLVDRRHLRGL